MTLCIAWRDGTGIIHLAGDSRLTANHSHLDVAIKILSIRCRFLDASLPNQRATIPVHEIDLAMAFAGSHLGAQCIKESLVEAFKELQYADSYSSPSMANIAKLFHHAYESISLEVTKIFGRSGLAKIFLAGFCHEGKKFKIYKFFPNNQSGQPISYEYSEIMPNVGELTMIGDMNAQSSARAILAQGVPPQYVLKAVIDDQNIKSVGGAVQYGHFIDNALQYGHSIDKIFFIYQELFHENNPPMVRYLRGGVDFNGQNMKRKASDDLHIRSTMYDYRTRPLGIVQYRIVDEV